MQGGVVSAEEERARVAEDVDSPYIDLNPLEPPQATEPDDHHDAWAEVFAGIHDTGGLLPAPGGSSSEAWGKVMSGIAGQWRRAFAMDEGGRYDRPPLAGRASPRRASTGRDAPSDAPPHRASLPSAADGHLGLGFDAFNPSEPRVGKGAAQGAGEWTKGSGGGQAQGSPIWRRSHAKPGTPDPAKIVSTLAASSPN